MLPGELPCMLFDGLHHPFDTRRTSRTQSCGWGRMCRVYGSGVAVGVGDDDGLGEGVAVGVLGGGVSVGVGAGIPSMQCSGLPCQSVPQPQKPLPGMSWQVQSQHVTPPVTQQPPAYQVVLMTQGFAQMPFSRQFSQEQGGPGKAQTVPTPAETALERVAVPAATPMSVPRATSAPRPRNPRREVLRASRSLSLRINVIVGTLNVIPRLVRLRHMEDTDS